MREVAAALRGKPNVRVVHGRERLTAAALAGLKLTKAYQYLGDVKEHKQVIPFRRFNGGVGRASQAKQFGATQGGCSCWTVIGVWRLTRPSCAFRSLAREICQIYPQTTEERRSQCRHEESRSRRTLHQEHCCPTGPRMSIAFQPAADFDLLIFCFRLENPSEDVPGPRPH